jgi:hypothetical protein
MESQRLDLTPAVVKDALTFALEGSDGIVDLRDRLQMREDQGFGRPAGRALRRLLPDGHLRYCRLLIRRSDHGRWGRTIAVR